MTIDSSVSEETRPPIKYQSHYKADLIVYGGTSAGVSTAVQAARKELKVILVSPTNHLGAMQSEGLTWVDFGYKEGIGGIAREFYRRMKAHYDSDVNWYYSKRKEFPFIHPRDDSMWQLEPHVAENEFSKMIEESGIEVFHGEHLDREGGVVKKGSRIVSITTLNGITFSSPIFIDATFEGDLMAAAGVSYTVGRESNEEYGETINGIQIGNAHAHQFEHDISAYIKPGDPSSGLLPNVHGEEPGFHGEADHRIQAYNFRICMTKVSDNRVPFPKPPNYDPLNYEILARYLDAGYRNLYRKFDPVPNGKTDTNNFGAFSTDYIGANYDYPEASYERRKVIYQEHLEYTQGLLWFMANDERVPEDVRQRMSQWGLCKDEYKDNNHWPRQLYIREARRMVSDFVVTERHIRRIFPSKRAICVGTHNMDSHHTQRYVDENGYVRNEGDVQVNPGGPYPIDYGAIVPKKQEASNLLVVAAVSASHIAYGSIRMEPVFMSLGQAAALASYLCLKNNTDVQDVNYPSLKAELERVDQITQMPNNWDWRADWAGISSNPNSQPTSDQLEHPTET